MALTEIERKLNKLGKEVIKRYPSINYGGCCVYAAIVATELKKYKIDACGIVASRSAGETDYSIDQARNNINKNTVQSWENNGIVLSHIGLEFEVGGKKKHYDTKGVRPASRYSGDLTIYKGRFQHAELKQLAAKKSGWNNHFNRRDIPAIRKLVQNRLAVDTTSV